MIEKWINGRFVIILFLLCIAPLPLIAEDTMGPYEQIYWADDNLPTKDHRFSVGFGVDTGNPILDIYNSQFGYNYSINSVIELGVIAKTYISQKTKLKDRVDQEFDLIGLQSEGVQPSWSSYITVSMIPFQGRVNMLGKKQLPFAILVSAGPGVRRTRESNNLYGWQWSFINRIFISEKISLDLNFTQEIEASFSSQENTVRNQLNALAGWSF